MEKNESFNSCADLYLGVTPIKQKNKNSQNF